VAISVRDQQEHAEASAHGTSLHVLQAVAKVSGGHAAGGHFCGGAPVLPQDRRARRRLKWTGLLCAAEVATAALALGQSSGLEVCTGPCPACRVLLCAHSGQARWAC
jgi:hypothetical protein